MTLNTTAKNDLSLVGDVMTAWNDYRERPNPSPPARVERLLAQYHQPSSVEIKRQLRQLSRGNANTLLRANPFEHFVLTPVRAHPPLLYPVARLEVSVKSGVVCISLRLVVHSHDDISGDLRARGWRYESADTGPSGGSRFHAFPHVQAISGWTRDNPDIHPPGDQGHELLLDDAVHEGRPAFPLRGTRPCGVLIAAMGSLYGAEQTLLMLETTPGKPLRDEAEAVLGST
ncbi:hypothetical protein [Cellulomonas persica]|uniref:Uncharacterized protein n=1 Tax=Cellulomonas persica TaxID=76861 RepID=A0A510UXY5_9CELL|nr:hypothetical protein [Cellulomonas persica]GEK19439.1 hypothetical protein CPE01_31720 [Cellulomonas persica]